MPILSASSSITRYRIIEDVPRQLFEELDERLAKNAFKDIDASAEERSFGWVSIDDWLDPGFHKAPPQKGEYLTLTMRLDTRRISPAVFKKHFQLALNAFKSSLPADGPKFVSKDRKEELREQVRLKLMARSLPVPALFDMIWNTRSHMVYFCSTNNKARDLFEDLFALTFGLNLEPLAPVFLALRGAGPDAEGRIMSIEPESFA